MIRFIDIHDLSSILFGMNCDDVRIVLFVIDVIIVMYILPHFTQTSRGFVKIISALVTCTKPRRHIFAVSPITFRRTTKRAPLPQGRDALFEGIDLRLKLKHIPASNVILPPDAQRVVILVMEVGVQIQQRLAQRKIEQL